MSERLRLKTEMQARKFRKMNLAVEAERKMDSIKDLLTLSSLTSLSRIDCGLIYSLAKELKKLKNEFTQVVEEIEKIEKELE